MRSTSRFTKSYGASLLEMAVGLSVAGILACTAIPSYNNYVSNAMVTGAIKNLANSLSTARAEAIRYGARAVVKPQTDSNWLSGWRVFIDKNRNDSYEAGTDELLVNVTESNLIGLTADTARTTGLSDIGYIGFDSAGITQAPVGSTQSPRAVITFINPSNKREQSVVVERSGKIWECNPLDTDTKKAAACK